MAIQPSAPCLLLWLRLSTDTACGIYRQIVVAVGVSLTLSDSHPREMCIVSWIFFRLFCCRFTRASNALKKRIHTHAFCVLLFVLCGFYLSKSSFLQSLLYRLSAEMLSHGGGGICTRSLLCNIVERNVECVCVCVVCGVVCALLFLGH